MLFRQHSLIFLVETWQKTNVYVATNGGIFIDSKEFFPIKTDKNQNYCYCYNDNINYSISSFPILFFRKQ